jgi:hypothetical protein
MKPFKHVLNTWLLAHVFHPLIFSIGLYIVTNEEIGVAFLIVWIGAMIISLPSLLFTTLLFDSIAQMQCSKWEKIFVWCVFSCACIIVNVITIPVIFFDDLFSYEYFQLALPALLSVFLSILIRHQQFENYLSFSGRRDAEKLIDLPLESNNF